MWDYLSPTSFFFVCVYRKKSLAGRQAGSGASRHSVHSIRHALHIQTHRHAHRPIQTCTQGGRHAGRRRCVLEAPTHLPACSQANLSSQRCANSSTYGHSRSWARRPCSTAFSSNGKRRSERLSETTNPA